MPLPDLLLGAILFFFIPLWLLVGFGDWLFHRKTHISETSGAGESLLHLLMLAEVGLPMLAGLFLEINALVLALMIAGFVAHEATVLWDLRYTANKRAILPGEQVIHSYQEAIPLMLLVLVAILHWEQFMALVTFGAHAEFRVAWKNDPLPPAYLAGILVAAGVLVVLPFLEELWRCYRHQAARRIAATLP
ncbi:hypothetical protein GCM10027343_16100 [Noviherbaspirillum agri]